MAGNPQQLVDALDTIMMHNTMSASMKNTIVTTVTNVSSANPALRTQTAIYLDRDRVAVPGREVKAMAQSRREFLRDTGCGISAAVLLASVEQFGLINAFAQQQPNVAADYKALVCIFLLGGNDGNNMVVPWDDYYNARWLRGGP